MRCIIRRERHLETGTAAVSLSRGSTFTPLFAQKKQNRSKLTSYAYGSAGSVYFCPLAILTASVTCGDEALNEVVGLVKLSTNCGSWVKKNGRICILLN